jgi:integrase
MAQSTWKRRGRKAADRPKKPYPDFPLSPHPSGAWQKKIRGKVHYFGRWGRIVSGKLARIEGDGWKEALELYKAQADDLHAGRTPRVQGNELTVADLCNRFLTAKQRKLDADEMSWRMFAEYRQTTDRLVSTFGKTRLVVDLAADDFEVLRADLAKQYGPVRLGNEVQKVRTVFKYALGQGLIDKPVRYGDEFKKPSKRVMRLHRAKNGKRMFEAVELRKLIETAGVPLKAMILLGINCGFGNADCGHLSQSAVDLERGWVSFPRPKTGIERRCPLWPETVAALRAALAGRPAPRSAGHADLIFITKYGRPWSTGGTSDAVTLEVRKLLRKLSLYRPGRAFYSLRHTFRTVADATRDFPAVRLVMGHADDTIDEVYREGIEDGRLRAVTEHVRAWLFAETPHDGTTATDRDAPERSDRPRRDEEGDARPTLRLFAG